MKPPARLLMIFLVIITFFFGFRDSPSFNPNTFRVEPAYLNGILTASGILYGLWAVVIGREPKTELKKWQYSNVVRELFFDSFFFLVFSVVYVSLTAVNVFLSTWALLFCVSSFLVNALAIFITFYFYKFDTEH
jgi:hypothetical protein